MDKIILVTGDSSGFGKHLCELFRNNGDTVYGVSRRPLDVPYTHYEADVCDYARLCEITADVVRKHGRIDMLICAAGIGIAGAAETLTAEDVDRQLRVNLNGVIYANKAVLPYMREQKSGRIVNISSVAAVAPMPFQSLYSASKAAVNAFSMALANELRPYGVDVLSVMPGDAKTGFTASRVKAQDPAHLYGGRQERSIAKMENDELTGMDGELVAKLIFRHATKKRPKVLYTVGTSYQILVFLMKIFPARLLNKALYGLYAK